MTDAQLKDPVKNIMVKGVEVPRVIDNGDGTVTWNLKSETATKMATMLLSDVLKSLAGRSKGLDGFLGGGKF